MPFIRNEIMLQLYANSVTWRISSKWFHVVICHPLLNSSLSLVSLGVRSSSSTRTFVSLQVAFVTEPFKTPTPVWLRATMYAQMFREVRLLFCSIRTGFTLKQPLVVVWRSPLLNIKLKNNNGLQYTKNDNYIIIITTVSHRRWQLLISVGVTDA